MMPISRLLKNRLLACVAAGGVAFLTSQSANAGQCGCEAHRHHGPMARPECTCEGQRSNCLQRAFESLASGIDKLFHCGESDCDDMLCDDACDAAMIEELMVPMAPMPMHHYHGMPHRSGPIEIEESYEVVPAEESPRMRTIPTPPANDLRNRQPRTGSKAGERISPPMQLEQAPPQRQTTPEEDTTEEEGSLFDSLSDPFGDDEAYVQPIQPIRPSSYQTIELRPIPRRPLPVHRSTSNRRVRNSR